MSIINLAWPCSIMLSFLPQTRKLIAVVIFSALVYSGWRSRAFSSALSYTVISVSSITSFNTKQRIGGKLNRQLITSTSFSYFTLLIVRLFNGQTYSDHVVKLRKKNFHKPYVLLTDLTCKKSSANLNGIAAAAIATVCDSRHITGWGGEGQLLWLVVATGSYDSWFVSVASCIAVMANPLHVSIKKA